MEIVLLHGIHEEIRVRQANSPNINDTRKVLDTWMYVYYIYIYMYNK